MLPEILVFHAAKYLLIIQVPDRFIVIYILCGLATLREGIFP